ncbi:hypothetical protein KF728_14935 [Candidatus Obscuribacterales bacterium]|nr:hypothetical protein [Candidatus Obscuribacterales bacterium]MBX3151446.1 hypothetical protein [Candidatus Obscuribacterales bacterium]
MNSSNENSFAILLIPFVSSLFLCGSAHADVLKLEYKIEKTIETEANHGKKTTALTTNHDSSNQTFLLDSNAFAISKNEDEMQFQFADRRIRFLDHKTRTYRDVSIYPILVNRFAAMQRTYLIRKELTDLKQEFQSNIDSFTMSCITGLPFPKEENVELSSTEKDKTVTFRHNGRVVTTVTFSDTPIADAFCISYGKALLYELELHPLVRKQILERKMVIERLSYDVELRTAEDFKSREKRSTTVQLIGTANDTGKILIPDGYKKAFSEDSPLHKLQETVFLPDHPIELPSQDKVVSDAQELIKKKETLDAFLCLLEFGIESNNATEPVRRMIKKLSQNESPISKMGKLHEARTNQEIAEALEEFDQIKKQAPLKGYLIEVFKGNVASQSDMKADEMFLNALNQNPLLTGTYVDLAAYSNSRKRFVLAWDCYDLARQICPDHPTLNRVRFLEKSLADSYPEYF